MPLLCGYYFRHYRQTPSSKYWPRYGVQVYALVTGEIETYEHSNHSTHPEMVAHSKLIYLKTVTVAVQVYIYINVYVKQDSTQLPFAVTISLFRYVQ